MRNIPNIPAESTKAPVDCYTVKVTGYYEDTVYHFDKLEDAIATINILQTSTTYKLRAPTRSKEDKEKWDKQFKGRV